MSNLYLYLKQNKFEIVECNNEAIAIIKIHGKNYKVYTDVKCSQCGAPIIAIIDNEEPGTLGYIPSTGCSNRFCKDYIH